MCVQKSGGGDTVLRGLAHPLVAKIGKVELVEASGAEIKAGVLKDHLDSSSRGEVKEHEAKNGSISIGNGHGMHQGEENVVVPKETNLSGVLESLMSLDPRGDFMGPLDGFSAPNHSKVVETPMCFAMMQEKIRTQQYSTWPVFVRDFERICYNALRCNQKRSIMWAAADDLLRRGKKRLEQYEGLGESLIALNKTGGSLASFDSKIDVLIKSKSENVEARVCQDDKSLVAKALKMAITSATSGSSESKPSSSEAAPLSKDVPVGKDACLTQRLKEETREDQISRNATPCLAPVLDVVSEQGSTQKYALKADVREEVRSVESSRRLFEGGPSKISSALGQTDEDIDVGERDLKSEDHRFDAVSDATESSSSYGSAGSAMEGEVDSVKMQLMFEAESNLRDGNGAVGLLEDDDGLPLSERGKKALDSDWKLYRRGIEWRCHWLELQTQAIKAKIGLYDKLLRSAQSEKIWKWEGVVGEGTSARTVPVKILRNHQVIHRKHRKTAEDALDLDLGRHPVFSRYEKRKTQRKSDDGFGSTQGKVDSLEVQKTDFEIAELEATFEKEHVEQQAAAGAAFVGQDSMEQLLWQVEALQVRVKKQKHVLKKETAVRKSSAAVAKAGLPNFSPRTIPPTQRGNSSAQVLPSPKAVPRVGPLSSSSGSLGRTSSGLARRRASDYDINNMVMPVNVGATFVEQVRHVDIETPMWRLLEHANPAMPRSEASSSDEETGDEHYTNRHAVMEVSERQQRYMPRFKKGAGDMHTVGKGKLKLGIGKSAVQMAGKGSSASLSLPSGPAPIIAHSADTVPKRQRSNRNAARRAPTSQVDLTVAETMAPEASVKSEVKRAVPVEDADANPLGV